MNSSLTLRFKCSTAKTLFLFYNLDAVLDQERRDVIWVCAESVDRGQRSADQVCSDWTHCEQINQHIGLISDIIQRSVTAPRARGWEPPGHYSDAYVTHNAPLPSSLQFWYLVSNVWSDHGCIISAGYCATARTCFCCFQWPLAVLQWKSPCCPKSILLLLTGHLKLQTMPIMTPSVL